MQNCHYILWIKSFTHFSKCISVKFSRLNFRWIPICPENNVVLNRKEAITSTDIQLQRILRQVVWFSNQQFTWLIKWFITDYLLKYNWHWLTSTHRLQYWLAIHNCYVFRKNAICVELGKLQCPMDHEMEMFSPNLDLCKVDSTQKGPMMWSCDVFLNINLNWTGCWRSTRVTGDLISHE